VRDCGGRIDCRIKPPPVANQSQINNASIDDQQSSIVNRQSALKGQPHHGIGSIIAAVTTNPTPQASAAVCPLCGGPNECGAAANQATCWCFTVVIPGHVVARVPDDQRGRACVCARCAAAPASPPADAGNRQT
jgi:hypothetical protein